MYIYYFVKKTSIFAADSSNTKKVSDAFVCNIKKLYKYIRPLYGYIDELSSLVSSRWQFMCLGNIVFPTFFSLVHGENCLDKWSFHAKKMFCYKIYTTGVKVAQGHWEVG